MEFSGSTDLSETQFHETRYLLKLGFPRRDVGLVGMERIRVFDKNRIFKRLFFQSGVSLQNGGFRKMVEPVQEKGSRKTMSILCVC